jgi:hypothetical protein
VALNAYLLNVRILLHDPVAQFYTDTTLTNFINQARDQIALEGECIRGIGNITLSVGTESYPFTSAVVPTTPLGIVAGGMISVRALTIIGSGVPNMVMESRNWDWFNFYNRGFSTPSTQGKPSVWSVLSQGRTGLIYISPLPSSNNYALQVDGVWLPVDLTADITPEALQFPWTDAIQYYAAYLAYIDSQRMPDADHMFQLYEEFMARARAGVTPQVTPMSYPGGQNSRMRGLPGQTPPMVNPGSGQPQGR